LPDPGASLDLTNPGDPLYTYPGTDSLENFQFEWGMDAAGQVSFSTPTPTPGDPLQYTFTGTDNLEDVYSIVLNFGGADPGSFVSLNPQPLPPFPDPNFGFLELDFTADGDPTVDFTVSSGNVTFAFSAVPEPSTLAFALLALGAVGLAYRCAVIRIAT
jgi:hypothetical protein